MLEFATGIVQLLYQQPPLQAPLPIQQQVLDDDAPGLLT